MVTSEACSSANTSKATRVSSLGAGPVAGIGQDHCVVKQNGTLSRGPFVVCWGIKDSVWHTTKHSLGSSGVLFHICFARNGTHSEYIAFLNFFPPARVECVWLWVLPHSLNDGCQAEHLKPGLLSPSPLRPCSLTFLRK